MRKEVENMEEVVYGGQSAFYDAEAGRVWSEDFEFYAVAECCELCGELVGTGLGYRADEPEYCVADCFVDRAMTEHLRRAHGELFED